MAERFDLLIVKDGPKTAATANTCALTNVLSNPVAIHRNVLFVKCVEKHFLNSINSKTKTSLSNAKEKWNSYSQI